MSSPNAALARPTTTFTGFMTPLCLSLIHIFASMGYDLPAAIGVCMAAHDPEYAGDGMSKEDIILLTGDGSIQMNLQELQTIIHHRMPIKMCIRDRR